MRLKTPFFLFRPVAWLLATLIPLGAIPLGAIPLGAIPLGAVPLGAQTIDDYKPLLENSPFLSAEFKARLAKAEVSALEKYSFNGYTNIDDDWLFCLIDKKTGLAKWVKIGDTLDEYTIESFAPKKHTITMLRGSARSPLVMDKPK